MEKLTKREAEVKALLDEGMTVKAAAKRLKVSPNAIYNYRRKIGAKLATPLDAETGTEVLSALNGSSNGKAPALVQIKAMIDDAIQTATDRTREIDGQSAELESEIATRTDALAKLSDERDRLISFVEATAPVAA